MYLTYGANPFGVTAPGMQTNNLRIVGNLTGAVPQAVQALQAMENAMGVQLSVIRGASSNLGGNHGYEGPRDRNGKPIPGAGASDHDFGKAFDLDTRSWTNEQKLQALSAAKQAGFTDFGLDDSTGNMHVGMNGAHRAWTYSGPGGHSIGGGRGIVKGYGTWGGIPLTQLQQDIVANPRKALPASLMAGAPQVTANALAYGGDQAQVLAPGSRNKPAIMALQKQLQANGFSLPKYGADGSYGKETAAAVRAAGGAGGIATPQFMASLASRSSTGATDAIGDVARLAKPGQGGTPGPSITPADFALHGLTPPAAQPATNPVALPARPITPTPAFVPGAAGGQAGLYSPTPEAQQPTGFAPGASAGTPAQLVLGAGAKSAAPQVPAVTNPAAPIPTADQSPSALFRPYAGISGNGSSGAAAGLSPGAGGNLNVSFAQPLPRPNPLNGVADNVAAAQLGSRAVAAQKRGAGSSFDTSEFAPVSHLSDPWTPGTPLGGWQSAAHQQPPSAPLTVADIPINQGWGAAGSALSKSAGRAADAVFGPSGAIQGASNAVNGGLSNAWNWITGNGSAPATAAAKPGIEAPANWDARDPAGGYMGAGVPWFTQDQQQSMNGASLFPGSPAIAGQAGAMGAAGTLGSGASAGPGVAGETFMSGAPKEVSWDGSTPAITPAGGGPAVSNPYFNGGAGPISRAPDGSVIHPGQQQAPSFGQRALRFGVPAGLSMLPGVGGVASAAARAFMGGASGTGTPYQGPTEGGGYAAGNSGGGYGGGYYTPNPSGYNYMNPSSSGYSTGNGGYSNSPFTPSGYSSPDFNSKSGGPTYAYHPDGNGGGTYINSAGNVVSY